MSKIDNRDHHVFRLSVFGLVCVLFCNCESRVEGIRGDSNLNNTVVISESATVSSAQENNYYVSSTLVDSLTNYVVHKYYGTQKRKIRQDFGEPDNLHTTQEGLIGPGIIEEGYDVDIYSLYGGTILFYYYKNTNNQYAIEVHASDSVPIGVPNLINKGPNYKDVVLNRSTFGEILKLGTIENFHTQMGSAPSATYSEIKMYFGNFGDYATIRGYAE